MKRKIITLGLLASILFMTTSCVDDNNSDAVEQMRKDQALSLKADLAGKTTDNAIKEAKKAIKDLDLLLRQEEQGVKIEGIKTKLATAKLNLILTTRALDKETARNAYELDKVQKDLAKDILAAKDQQTTDALNIIASNLSEYTTAVANLEAKKLEEFTKQNDITASTFELQELETIIARMVTDKNAEIAVNEATIASYKLYSQYKESGDVEALKAEKATLTEVKDTKQDELDVVTAANNALGSLVLRLQTEEGDIQTKINDAVSGSPSNLPIEEFYKAIEVLNADLTLGTAIGDKFVDDYAASPVYEPAPTELTSGAYKVSFSKYDISKVPSVNSTLLALEVARRELANVATIAGYDNTLTNLDNTVTTPGSILFLQDAYTTANAAANGTSPTTAQLNTATSTYNAWQAAITSRQDTVEDRADAVAEPGKLTLEQTKAGAQRAAFIQLLQDFNAKTVLKNQAILDKIVHQQTVVLPAQIPVNIAQAALTVCEQALGNSTLVNGEPLGADFMDKEIERLETEIVKAKKDIEVAEGTISSGTHTKAEKNELIAQLNAQLLVIQAEVTKLTKEVAARKASYEVALAAL